jgi:hypothetical protein
LNHANNGLESLEIIGLTVAGLLLLGLFLARERRAPEPVLPLKLFRDEVFSVGSALLFIQGLVMFGAIVFLPLSSRWSRAPARPGRACCCSR